MNCLTGASPRLHVTRATGRLSFERSTAAGSVLTEQHLGLRAPSRFSLRWDLGHDRAVMLLPADGGGIDVRVVAFGQGAGK